MFIKLNTPKGTVIYLNTRNLSHIYSMEGSSIVQCVEGTTFKVKETPEEIMALMDERV